MNQISNIFGTFYKHVTLFYVRTNYKNLHSLERERGGKLSWLNFMWVEGFLKRNVSKALIKGELDKTRGNGLKELNTELKVKKLRWFGPVQAAKSIIYLFSLNITSATYIDYQHSKIYNEYFFFSLIK